VSAAHDLTVVIPARDAEATIGRAVRSALRQTCRPAAVLVVDDGSRDGTADAATAAGATVVAGEGRGVAAARNAGLRAATSAWVGFLDADDWWEPGLIAAAREATAGSPSPVACFVAANAVNDDGAVVARHRAPARITLADLVLGEVIATTSATVVARQIALDLGGFHEGFRRPAGVEDLDLWVRLAAAGPCVGVPDAHATYVVHDARDAARAEHELADLAADRREVIDRTEQRLGRPLPRSRAIMEARTARYWLRGGHARRARAAAVASLRIRPTAEGAITLLVALAPTSLRAGLIDVRRRLARR
jgi:GT2 family glycosyltransferase